jgi:hypothetical protein
MPPAYTHAQWQAEEKKLAADMNAEIGYTGAIGTAIPTVQRYIQRYPPLYPISLSILREQARDSNRPSIK